MKAVKSEKASQFEKIQVGPMVSQHTKSFFSARFPKHGAGMATWLEAFPSMYREGVKQVFSKCTQPFVESCLKVPVLLDRPGQTPLLPTLYQQYHSNKFPDTISPVEVMFLEFIIASYQLARANGVKKSASMFISDLCSELSIKPPMQGVRG